MYTTFLGVYLVKFSVDSLRGLTMVYRCKRYARDVMEELKSAIFGAESTTKGRELKPVIFDYVIAFLSEHNLECVQLTRNVNERNRLRKKAIKRLGNIKISS